MTESERIAGEALQAIAANYKLGAASNERKIPRDELVEIERRACVTLGLAFDKGSARYADYMRRRA